MMHCYELAKSWLDEARMFHRREEQEHDYTLDWGADNEVDPARCECDDVLCLDCLVAEWDAR
jgi:hypothetical protein